MATAPHPSPGPATVPAHVSAAEELQLLRQVAAREPQAFDTLYHRSVHNSRTRCKPPACSWRAFLESAKTWGS